MSGKIYTYELMPTSVGLTLADGTTISMDEAVQDDQLYLKQAGGSLAAVRWFEIKFGDFVSWFSYYLIEGEGDGEHIFAQVEKGKFAEQREWKYRPGDICSIFIAPGVEPDAIAAVLVGLGKRFHDRDEIYMKYLSQANPD